METWTWTLFICLLLCIIGAFRVPIPRKKTDCSLLKITEECVNASLRCDCFWCSGQCIPANGSVYIPFQCVQTEACETKVSAQFQVVILYIATLCICFIMALFMFYVQYLYPRPTSNWEWFIIDNLGMVTQLWCIFFVFRLIILSETLNE